METMRAALQDMRMRFLPAGSLRARFARGAAWSVVGAAGSQGLAVFASVFMARILGVRGFGEVGMIQSTVGMLGTFAGMGLGVTVTKYVSELHQVAPDRTGRILGLTYAVAIACSGLGAIVLLAAAPMLARSISAPHLESELRIAAGLLFLNGIGGIQSSVLAGFEAFRDLATVNFARGLVTLPSVVLGAIYFGVPGAMWGLVVSAAIGWVVGETVLRRVLSQAGVPLHLEGSWRESEILWSFSVPSFLGSVIVVPLMWAANALLAGQPGGYRELGVFNAANQWRNAITLVPAILTQPALPILSSLRGMGDRASFRRVLHGTLLWVFAISFAAALAVIAASRWILGAYGPEFRNGVVTLCLLAAAGAVSATAATIGQAIAGLGRMWGGFWLNLVWAIAFLGIALWLVPRYGAIGLAWATLSSYCLHAVNTYLFSQRILLTTRT